MFLPIIFLVIGFSFVNSQSAYTTAESNFTTVITTQNTSESQTTAAFTTGQTTTQSPTTDTTSSSPNSTTTTTTKVSPITQSPSRKFDGLSFIGGMILAAGLSGILFLIVSYLRRNNRMPYSNLS